MRSVIIQSGVGPSPALGGRANVVGVCVGTGVGASVSVEIGVAVGVSTGWPLNCALVSAIASASSVRADSRRPGAVACHPRFLEELG